MDLTKLTLGDKIIAGSGLALFIFAFLPWFKAKVTISTFGMVASSAGSQKGWDYFFTGIVPVLIGLALIAYVAVTRFADVEMPALPVPYGLVVLGLAGLAALLVVLRLLIGSNIDENEWLSVNRSFGLYLSTLAVLGLVGGAAIKFTQEDETSGQSSSAKQGF